MRHSMRHFYTLITTHCSLLYFVYTNIVVMIGHIESNRMSLDKYRFKSRREYLKKSCMSIITRHTAFLF
jgi:hypothetical protein